MFLLTITKCIKIKSEFSPNKFNCKYLTARMSRLFKLLLLNFGFIKKKKLWLDGSRDKPLQSGRLWGPSVLKGFKCQQTVAAICSRVGSKSQSAHAILAPLENFPQVSSNSPSVL